METRTEPKCVQQLAAAITNNQTLSDLALPFLKIDDLLVVLRAIKASQLQAIAFFVVEDKRYLTAIDALISEQSMLAKISLHALPKNKFSNDFINYLAESLHEKKSGIKINFYDERLVSGSSVTRMFAKGLKYNKQDVDKTNILESPRP